MKNSGWLILLIVINIIIIIISAICMKDVRNTNVPVITPNIGFIDRPVYDTLEKKKDTVNTTIIKIEYEKNIRLEKIDSISNDSAVVLFYKLVAE
jgi:hypothetical protein